MKDQVSYLTHLLRKVKERRPAKGQDKISMALPRYPVPAPVDLDEDGCREFWEIDEDWLRQKLAYFHDPAAVMAQVPSPCRCCDLQQSPRTSGVAGVDSTLLRRCRRCGFGRSSSRPRRTPRRRATSRTDRVHWAHGMRCTETSSPASAKTQGSCATSTAATKRGYRLARRGTTQTVPPTDSPRTTVPSGALARFDPVVYGQDWLAAAPQRVNIPVGICVEEFMKLLEHTTRGCDRCPATGERVCACDAR